MLTAAGLKAPVRPRIRDEIWVKLWGNLSFNPISALTHATLDVLCTDPGTRGVARAMLGHCLDTARDLGFRAMQFNFVVETNAGALRLWLREGYAEVGRLPGAFHHPRDGYVDALVLYKTLVPPR